MGRTRYYCFKYSNGKTKYHTPQEAIDYSRENKTEIIHNGFTNAKATKRRVRDGFQAGFNPGLGEYVGGPREYAQKCKEKGLVEVGNVERTANHEKETDYFSNELGRDLSEAGMSDREIDSMRE